MNRATLGFLLIFGCVLAQPAQSRSEFSSAISRSLSLSLQSYLDQVRQHHRGYRAAQENSMGALLKASEAQLLDYPTFTANAQALTDARPQLNAFAPQKIDSTALNLTVEQQLPLGLKAKLNYLLSHTELDVPPSTATFFNVTGYYDAIPSVELTLPLLRGRGGSEFRADRTSIEASHLAIHYNESFRSTLILVEAEISYWRLVKAREIVSLQKRILKRAHSLEEWAKNRLKLRLGDTGDLLQTQAAKHQRELELQLALHEERAAAQSVNSLRGRALEEAIPQLDVFPDLKQDLSLESPTSLDLARPRSDLSAAEQSERWSAAQANQIIERNRPQLNLFASLALNGRGVTSSEAIRRGWEFDQKTTLIGVQLVSSLDLWSRAEARRGATREREAASLDYDRKRFEHLQEYRDLKRKLLEAQDRLKLTQSLAYLHSAKLEREQDKLKRGRNTTFQVIQFETESALAQVEQLRAQFELAQVLARLASFSPPSETQIN